MHVHPLAYAISCHLILSIPRILAPLWWRAEASSGDKDPFLQAQDNLVLDLIKQSVGIDIFIMTLVGILDGAEVTQLRNAAGDHVLLVMATTSSAGRYMSNITARFGASGLLLPEQVRVNSIDLSSEVQAHNATWDRVLEYEQNMTIAMGQIKGHIAADLSGSSGSGPNCIRVEWGEDGTACGCRVAQCGAGDLTADAIAWYTKADIGVSNAGGIRSDLSSGAVTRGTGQPQSRARCVQLCAYRSPLSNLPPGRAKCGS